MQNWSRRVILQAIVACLLAACSSGQVGNISYKVGVRGEGNQVAIVHDTNQPQGGYIVQVESAKGIGQAAILWWGTTSPHPLIFELHTSGLENFTLKWAGQIVNVSVNSTDNSVIESIQTEHQDEVAISTDSPYWMDVRLPSPDEIGFQLTAPPAFIQAAPSLWAISWIDFYR